MLALKLLVQKAQNHILSIATSNPGLFVVDMNIVKKRMQILIIVNKVIK
jgi:hypothetical protein